MSAQKEIKNTYAHKTQSMKAHTNYTPSSSDQHKKVGIKKDKGIFPPPPLRSALSSFLIAGEPDTQTVTLPSLFACEWCETRVSMIPASANRDALALGLPGAWPMASAPSHHMT